MIKKITLALLPLLFVQLVQAQQEPFFKTYDWEEKPSYTVEKEDTDSGILEVKDKMVTEFYFLEDNYFTEYLLEHRVIWLNSDEKIEEFNKIYLPYSSSSEILTNKARVITKNGKVLELEDKDILTAEDQETGRKYKYFAFEGIDKGSFIEYYYVIQKQPNYGGKRITFQSDYDSQNVEFDLYAPTNLVFEFKSYNGLPEVEFDTVNTKHKLHWQMKANRIKALDEEENSAYDAQKEFLIYKLDRNLANNTRGISSYDMVSQRMFSFLYPEDRSRKEEKSIKKFISKIDTKGEEKNIIRNVENYIKANIYISEGASENLEDLDYIISNKAASSRGVMKLYSAIFSELEIEHEVVLTSNRMQLTFDKDFEASSFLNDFLVYFPTENTYLSPDNLDSRLGYPPANLTDNFGLFIKKVKVGDFESGVGEIKYISPVPSEKSYDNMLVDVSFDNEDLSKCQVSLNRSLFGYYASFIQPHLNLIKQEGRDNILTNMAEQLSENIEITHKELVNDDPALFGIEPLQFVVGINSNAFVEKAGNKYLFKVGKLIGKQTELYQEKERVLPLEENFMRKYFRTLNIQIPEGYQIANLEDLTINENYVVDGTELLAFQSSYELKGGVLTIQADEHYSVNKLSAEEYPNYRRIINTAADFNKITLILEPK